MLQAMLASMSSIEAQQSRMEVIGNNLANVNTTGFKSSDTDFEDMVSQIIREGVAPLQYGQGVMVGSTVADVSQGALNATNVPSDLALQGGGYFTLSNGTGYVFSRDGSFGLDASGELVQNSTGLKVLGWMADSSGNINNNNGVAPTSTITLPMGILNSVKQTSTVGIGGNLSSKAKKTDSVSMGVNVFDSLGGTHDVTITFGNHTAPPGAGAPKGAASSWTWSAAEGTTALGSSSSKGNTVLYFDASGNLLNPQALGNITIPASGSAGAVPIQLNFSGLTQNAAASNVQSTGQDGAPPGQLSSFVVGGDGTITGIFTNGLTKTLAQVAVASFSNPGGLAKLGSNLLGASVGSGPASIGVAGQGGRGAIQSGFLEQSNVDVGTQFTNLIVTQRGYQANTKVVTAVDQMLQDLLSMVQ